MSWHTTAEGYLQSRVAAVNARAMVATTLTTTHAGSDA